MEELLEGSRTAVDLAFTRILEPRFVRIEEVVRDHDTLVARRVQSEVPEEHALRSLRNRTA